jgi:predicted lysophospholipase L1 biosynthesis ABC-type transport system permease subunit
VGLSGSRAAIFGCRQTGCGRSRDRSARRSPKISLFAVRPGDPAQFAGVLRAELAHFDPGIPLYRVRTFDSLVSSAASEPRFQMLLVTCFALLALALAAVGLYAVLSYMVAQRTTEIGLRMALGAQPGDVLRWVLRRGLAMAIAGVAIGLAVSAAVTRSICRICCSARNRWTR